MANAENFSLACNTFEAWVSVDNKALEQFAVQKTKTELCDEASCLDNSEKDQVRYIHSIWHAIDPTPPSSGRLYRLQPFSLRTGRK